MENSKININSKSGRFAVAQGKLVEQSIVLTLLLSALLVALFAGELVASNPAPALVAASSDEAAQPSGSYNNLGKCLYNRDAIAPLIQGDCHCRARSREYMRVSSQLDVSQLP